MYQEERLVKILELLKEKETLTNQEIVETFSISRDTARRDIVKLVDEGLATRTHGGITLSSLHDIGHYNYRKTQNQEIKNKIAKQAAKYMTVHKVCFFDVSTTIEELCNYIGNNINAFTHSLDNIETLAKHCRVNMIGGQYFSQNRYMCGYATLEAIDYINFDIAYLGAASIEEDGIYVEEAEDAAIKRKVAEKSACVCVLADHTKFHKKSTFKALSFSDINIITTDQPLPENILKNVREAGCVIDIVE